MKIIADAHIPFIQHYFKDAVLIPGRAMTQANVKTADVLLVRSVTLVNENLLKNTAVKFVGSVTTGLDHLDMAWLQKANIDYAASLGFNAIAVAEYVLYVIAYLQQQQLLEKKGLRIAVIGVGRIGSVVAKLLEILDVEVIYCDPIRAAADKSFQSTPLDDIQDIDLVSLHTPLTKTGPHPSFHLIQKDFLQKQKPGCVLLNTSRGSVISFADLKKHGQHLVWCLDVWEDEPRIDLEVLAKACIATPHIAGYSLQSQYRGIAWIYQTMVDRGLVSAHSADILTYPTRDFELQADQTWQDVLLALYDPDITTRQMKAALVKSHTDDDVIFDGLRKSDSARCELSFTKFSITLPILSRLQGTLR